MSTLETYRKQAKLLVRWHREGNYSIGGRIRGLLRYGRLTDTEALALPFPLREAQEIIAREAGYEGWPHLKAALDNDPHRPRPAAGEVAIKSGVPVLYVRNVAASADFYSDMLGFDVDFLHGHPPFYGSVSRDGARLHLKFVHQPVFDRRACAEEGLIMAHLEVENVKALFAEYAEAGVEFAQKLVKQAWGGTDFHVADPDGNLIAFVG